MSLLQYAPQFDSQQAVQLAKDFYNLAAVAEELPSERDQNFLLTTEQRDKFVLKIANSKEQQSLLGAQNLVMSHLQSRVNFCPRIISTATGESMVQIQSDSRSHYVRVVSYISGEPLAKVPHSSGLLFDFGKKLGTLACALADFDDPAVHREFHWDLANGLKVVNEYSKLLSEQDLRGLIDDFAESIQHSLEAMWFQLPRSVIHGDANNYNVIVENGKVVGLVDFGDMIHSYTIGELAVAVAYIVLDKTDPLSSAVDVVRGYLSKCSLNESEIDALWTLMLLRLSMSVCLAEHQREQKPENAYLAISQRSIRNTLPRLFAIDPRAAADRFLACKAGVNINPGA